MKINKTYKAISCDISGHNDRLMSHVETESQDKIRVPADGKSTARIIRQLSNTKVIVQCLWCGKFFETYLCKIKIGRGKYCCKRCLGKASGKQRSIDKKGVFTSDNVKGSNNHNWQGGDFQDCEICGTPFWKYPSRKQVTCSVGCGYIRAKTVRCGLSHSLGHRSDYAGVTHWEKIRYNVLIRDNFTCQECSWYAPINTGILHAHHKVRLINGGLNVEENLITLCKNCHSRIHKYDRVR